MSAKEFWEEEPKLLWAYRKSYIEKIKMQNEMSNYQAWLNGLYVFDALSKCLYNSLGRKQSQPVINYVEKPFELNIKKTKEDIIKEERLRVEEKIKERNRQIKELLKKK